MALPSKKAEAVMVLVRRVRRVILVFFGHGYGGTGMGIFWTQMAQRPLRERKEHG